MRTHIRFALCAALTLAITAVGGSPALAASPWWHLSSSTRPSYLQPGQAKDEVQQVTVSSSVTEYHLFNHGVGLFERGGQSGPKQGEVTLERGEAPAAMQIALEETYGTGTVEVTGGPEVYEMTFAGRLADLPVNLMSANRQEEEEHLVEIKELAKGRPDGEIVLTAANLGDGNAGCVKVAAGAGRYTSANCSEEGAGEFERIPVTVSDVLPAGLKAVAIEGAVDENLGAFAVNSAPIDCSLGSLSCTFTGQLGSLEYGAPQQYPKFVPPYELIRVIVAVNLTGPSSPESNVASVTGGGAPAARASEPVTVSATPPPFGVSSYEIRPEAQGGGLDTQAGSHPFQLTTTLNVNETFGEKPVGLAKDLHFKLPAGLIGNPAAIPQCPMAKFLTHVNGGGNECSTQTIVGVARSTFNLFNGGQGHHLTPVTEPVYNVEPAIGEPARFGFIVEEVPVLLTTAVRTGGDYGVTVNVTNITEEVEFLSSEVTFWGVPGDELHDNARGVGCMTLATQAADGGEPEPEGPKCPPLEEHSAPPFLSLPTSCTATPLQTTVEADSWEEPHDVLSFSSTAPMPAMDGCDRLPFEPRIEVKPDGESASTPTGLTVDVHVHQDGQLNAEGLADSNVRDIKVTLPEGMILNPAAADGLEACTEAQIGYLPGESHPPSELRFTSKIEPPFCPDAAKVAKVKIKSPLLPAGQLVEGAVYLASPQSFHVFPQENPFESLIAMYIVAEDPISGFLLKLPGWVALNQQTGRISATFEDSPQLAFEDAEIHFFGGERAPLASPAHCGTYTTEATFTPWSGTGPVNSTSSFNITTGPSGTPCPSPLPFTPSLAAGSPNINAGAFSPLTTTISRQDGNQNIQTVQLHMAPGMSGILAGVPLCPEAQANAGTCGPESQIGETIVSVGLGGDPFTVTGGKVYLTEKYEGAPFGLSIVNPAKAGPFNLQEGRPVVVRARIEIDPRTAALTITTGQIPHIIDGFPLQIKHVNVTINRPGFTFNPTDCNPLRITGSIGSVEEASSPVSVPFQVTNCAALKFTPKFTVSTSGKTSKANGASLTTKLAEPVGALGTQANIARVKVELPKQLPSRLKTLQKACTNAQFESNPAGCPAASFIGHAVVHTPLLPVPLEGPAIFVSHGGEAFPSLIMVLQGYGVTVDLVGTTFISKAGVTSTTFKTVPDTPFNTFELTLPQGEFSALATNGNLCTSKLVMPTEFLAQNGAVIHQNTPVSATGCAKKKLTRAQKLAAALKACKKKAKGKRAACTREARRKYGPLRKKTKK